MGHLVGLYTPLRASISATVPAGRSNGLDDRQCRGDRGRGDRGRGDRGEIARRTTSDADPFPKLTVKSPMARAEARMIDRLCVSKCSVTAFVGRKPPQGEALAATAPAHHS